MNSHVQIPKSILRNFSYKMESDGWVVDYLDLKDKQIKTEKGTIDHLHIDEEQSVQILNDFSLEIEKYTNNQFIVGNKPELIRLKERL